MTESHNSSRGDGSRSGRVRTVTAGTPARRRELRAQGRRTMRRLSDAGMRVFAERGYHAARVDDIVRAARTSHGTFYLYFANKEDLLRTLAADCAAELHRLADGIGAIGSDPQGFVALRQFLAQFVSAYRRYGVVIRAWMEDQVSDREVDRLGVRAFTAIAARLAERMDESGARQPVDSTTSIGALMAMLERCSYAVASRGIEFPDEVLLDTIAQLVHRGFFGGAVNAA